MICRRWLVSAETYARKSSVGAFRSSINPRYAYADISRAATGASNGPNDVRSSTRGGPFAVKYSMLSSKVSYDTVGGRRGLDTDPFILPPIVVGPPAIPYSELVHMTPRICSCQEPEHIYTNRASRKNSHKPGTAICATREIAEYLLEALTISKYIR